MTKQRARPVAIDIFCGAGGMSLGFEQAGFEVAAAFDNNPINIATYANNFPDAKALTKDVHSLTAKAILAHARVTSVDVLFGGPPCQGFSVIGKRRNDDPRNELLHEFARLVDELRPRYFVVENVAGLMIGDARRSLDTFLASVKAAGYSWVDPVQVLDASDYGVPQQRKRVFILGYRRKLMAPTYPIPDRSDLPTVWDAIGDLAMIDAAGDGVIGDVYSGRLGTSSHYARIMRGQLRDNGDGLPLRMAAKASLTGCATSVHTKATIRRFERTDQGKREPISKFHRLKADGISYTLRAGTGPENGSFMAARPIHPEYARCITVREAARLHSFPDWFGFHETKWHGFRQVGNSVPPRMARAVAKSILSALNNK